MNNESIALCTAFKNRNKELVVERDSIKAENAALVEALKMAREELSEAFLCIEGEFGDGALRDDDKKKLAEIDKAIAKAKRASQ